MRKICSKRKQWPGLDMSDFDSTLGSATVCMDEVTISLQLCARMLHNACGLAWVRACYVIWIHYCQRQVSQLHGYLTPRRSKLSVARATRQQSAHQMLTSKFQAAKWLG
eukprot:4638064-Amphidinium_carterae.1